MPNPDGSPTFIERFAAALGRGAARVIDAWRFIDIHQKVAAGSAVLLLISLALPWYQVSASNTVSGFGCFTFVEGAIVLVCVAVLWMLFARGEERAFHLPGGDGSIIALAGAWCLGLLTWRIVVYPPSEGGYKTQIEWGVMVAMGAAALLLGAGLRMRAAHIQEPPMERQLTIDGHVARPVIPAPEVEPAPAEEAVDPTVEQLAIPIDDDPRPRKRTRRRPSK